MTRIPTRPLDDPRMWRRAVAAAHPDKSGGDHELCIWMQALREKVCQGELDAEPKPRPAPRSGQPSSDEPARVSYPPGTDFEAATRQALRRAKSAPEKYSRLLMLLADCFPLLRLEYEERRGASYKRLAAIGYAVGMTREERSGWYRIAESIPLSDRHAGHILSSLNKGPA